MTNIKEQINDLSQNAFTLFKANAYSEAIDLLQKVLNLTSQLEDCEDKNQALSNTYRWLGLCYVQQQNFQQAIENIEQALTFARKLKNNENKNQALSSTYQLLGQCYFKQQNFQQAIENIEQALTFVLELENNENNNQTLSNIYQVLGLCYFEQQNFQQAIENLKQASTFAQKLENNENKNQALSSTYQRLGLCYFKQQNFQQALKNLEQALTFTLKLENNEDKNQALSNTYQWLGLCYLEQQNFQQALENLEKASTFAQKLKIDKNKNQALSNTYYLLGQCYFMQEHQKHENFKQVLEYKYKLLLLIIPVLKNLKPDLQKALGDILSTLVMFPYEIENMPLAHYTTPNICNQLLGINYDDQTQTEASPMRMNISTYMNDPTEGKSILDFLGIPHYVIENKIEPNKYCAFFSCFSSRINDLNQFRLYGKVENINASGCCLVFNKNKPLCKNIHQAKPIFTLENKQIELHDNINQDNLIFQVAYLAYKDEYTQPSNQDINLDNFFIYLEPIKKNQFSP